MSGIQVGQGKSIDALVEALAGYRPPPLPISVTWPGNRLMPPRVHAFIDVLAPQLASLDAVLEAVPDCPVIMGLTGSNMRSVLGRLDQLRHRRIAGILAPAPPYYIRPSQAGLVEYFHTLAGLNACRRRTIYNASIVNSFPCEAG